MTITVKSLGNKFKLKCKKIEPENVYSDLIVRQICNSWKVFGLVQYSRVGMVGSLDSRQKVVFDNDRSNGKAGQLQIIIHMKCH